MTSAGATGAEKAANACTGCELLPTKPAHAGGDRVWNLALVERFRRERDSGDGIDLGEMSAAIWQLVQLWDQLEVYYERSRAHDLHDAMRALMHERT